MTDPKFRVAICGGGIGGLTLAVALSKYPDIQVDLYEAAGQFKEIGAGVMIWERTWHILESLGMANQFSSIAHAPPDGSMGVGFDYRKSDQPEEGSRFFLFEVPYGCIRFHRAQFLDVLVDRLPPGVAHFGRRLVRYTRAGRGRGPLTLEFADGSTAPCDLLVGCDGIKSTIRKSLLEEQVHKHGRDASLLRHIDPVWSGTIAYRGLIPVERLTANGREHRTVRTPMMYCGKSKHVVSYAISGGTIVNVVALVSQPHLRSTPYPEPWVQECSESEVLDCFSGWEPEVEELLKCIEKPTRWALHELRPLPLYGAGRVVLLGDAAHAMTPHQGAGAGQAIEDAYVLAKLLGHPSITVETLDSAVSAYEHIRLPVANHVVHGSRTSGAMYEFDGEHGDDLARLGPAIGRQWDWLWATTPEEEAKRGLAILQKRLGVCTRL